MKKAADFTDELGKQANNAKLKFSQTTEQFTETDAYRKLSQVDQLTKVNSFHFSSFSPSLSTQLKMNLQMQRN